ncbi:MAG: DUF6290 family protein [Campylobacteraceae bacterium]|jgi:RHH-type rel operon transcriptional repressor/antitoxin RelB|nr:DUF6290 family protein [Campylobacteraceae bacterium]
MPLSIRLPKDMEDRLSTISKEAKVSKAHIIKEAISTHLEDLEDYYRAVKALKEFKDSGEKSISANEVFKKLGL